ncbi:MAG: hypothetical protein QF681_00105 [Vicinamibacterales bacterium]|jgi:hypothetical protein|nr:hypothetical protein [Vicinamibacterales bacterium]
MHPDRIVRQTPRQVSHAGRLVFLLSLCLYVTTAGGSMATDIMTYEVTKSIVEHGSVAMSYDVFGMEAHRGVDGRYYAPYGIGHALYSAPFYLAGATAERLTGLDVGKADAVRKASLVVGSAVAAAAIVWLAFWFTWRLFGAIRLAILSALSLGFATMLWPYSKFGFSAPLATLCVLAGVYGVWVGARLARPGMLVAGGVGIGWALLVRHELVLIAVPVTLWLALEYRPKWRQFFQATALVAAPIVVAVLLTAYYNAVRFGNPIDTGYLRDETAGIGSVWLGAWGFLVSPGGSVFLYSPLLILGAVALAEFSRVDRRTAILFGGVMLTLFCFYASLFHWEGERSYGPRYLLPMLPFLCLPLGVWFARPGGEFRRRAAIAGLICSVAVQIPGVLLDFSKVGHTPELGYRSIEARRWEWGSAALVLNTQAAMRAVPLNARYLSGAEPRPEVKAAEGLARDFSSQFAFSLDLWWMYLFHLRIISAPVALVLAGLPLGLAAACAHKLRRLSIADG